VNVFISFDLAAKAQGAHGGQFFRLGKNQDAMLQAKSEMIL
jgi:hypothetical protein